MCPDGISGGVLAPEVNEPNHRKSVGSKRPSGAAYSKAPALKMVQQVENSASLERTSLAIT
jgi:hypothetical protein